MTAQQPEGQAGQDYGGLVEWLRAPRYEIEQNCAEAAEAIEALQAERDALSKFFIENSKDFIGTFKRAEAAEAELARLRAVVEAAQRALESSLAVLDESSREEMAKQLTNAELGQLWLATTAEVREALDRLGEGNGEKEKQDA